MALTESGIRFKTEGEDALTRAIKTLDSSLKALDKATVKASSGFADLTAATKRAEKIGNLTDKIKIQQKGLDELQEKLTKSGSAYNDSAEKAKTFQSAIEKSQESIKQKSQRLDYLKQSLILATAKYGEGSEQVKTYANLIDKTTASIKLEEKELASFQQGLVLANKEQEKSAESSKKYQSAIDKLSISIRQNEQAVAGLNREEEESKKNTQENIAAKARAADAAGKAATAVADLRTKLEQEGEAAKKSAASVEDSNRAVDNVDNVSRKAATSIIHLGNSLRDSGHYFDVFDEIATGALRRVGELAIETSLEVGRAFADLGKSAITLAGDYEATMNRFVSVAGGAIEDAGLTPKMFDDLAIDLGALSQFSAPEVADAMVELAKGGVDVKDILEGTLEATLNLAAAGEVDLARAAEIVAKRLEIWGKDGLTATRVTNLIAQAANASTTSVNGVATALAASELIGKSYGATIEDLIVGSALMAGGFDTASDAGTSYKAMFNSLEPKTKAQIIAAQELGLVTKDNESLFFDLEGNYIGLASAADLLQKSVEGLTKEKRGSLLEDLFGSDGARAANVLIEKGAAGVNALTDAMNKSGTAKEQAAERTKGYNAALESLKGSLEGLGVVIGRGAFLPFLENLMRGTLIPATNAVTNFFEALFGGVSLIGGATPGLKFFEDTAASMAEAFEGMISPKAQERLENLITLTLKFVDMILPDLFSGAASAGKSISDMIDAGIISLFDGLSDAIVFISVHWGDITTSVNSSIKAIGDFIAFVDELTGYLFASGQRGTDNVLGLGEFPKSLRGIIKGAGDAIKVFADFGKAIAGALSGKGAGAGVFDAIKSAIGSVGGVIGGFLSNANAVQGALVGIGTAITGAGVLVGILAIGSALLSLINPVTLFIGAAALLGAAWQTNFGGIQEITATVLDYLYSGFSAVTTYLVGVFGPVYEAFRLFGAGALQEIWTLVTGGQTAFSNLNVIIGQTVMAVWSFLADIVGAVVSNIPNFVGALLQFGGAMITWLLNLDTVVLQNFGRLLFNFIGYLGVNLPGWIAALATWGAEMVAWIGRALPVLIVELSNFLLTMTGWAENEVKPGLESKALQWAYALYSWIEDVLIPQVKPAMDKFWHALKIALENILNVAGREAKRIGQAIIDGIVNALKNGANQVYNAVASLMGGTVTAAEDATETHSPSRVFARIGAGLVDGLIQGLQSNQATGAVSTLLGSVIATSQQLLGQWVALLAKFGLESWMWAQKALPLLQVQMLAWGNAIMTTITGQLPSFVAKLSLWSLEAWRWLQLAMAPLQAQMLLFSTALQMWATTIVLLNLKTGATQWAKAAYEWIPNELMPGIQPLWTMFLNDSILHMKRMEDEMFKSGKKVGKAIIGGILEGILQNKHKIVLLLIEVMTEAINAAKQELGISSPSKVFYTLGEQIMDGMSGGIAAGARSTAKVMTSAVDSLIPGFAAVPVSFMPSMAATDIATAGLSETLSGLSASSMIASAGQGGSVQPPASGSQINNQRAINNSYSNQKNYSLTVNSPRESQGVVQDFYLLQVMEGGGA